MDKRKAQKDDPRDILLLVQPEASSPPLAARARASLPSISCTRIKKLLGHLSAENLKKCPQQTGLGFLAGVLIHPPGAGRLEKAVMMASPLRLRLRLKYHFGRQSERIKRECRVKTDERR